MALETTLSIGAGMVIIQELFIGNREICHSGFNSYWPQKKRKEIRIMTEIRNDLANKIWLDHRTDLINHPYFMLLEIRKLDTRSKRPGRKTRVINMYENRVGSGRIWHDSILCIGRVLEDVG